MLQKFVIEGIYSSTGCVRAQHLFEVDVSVMQDILGIESKLFHYGWVSASNIPQLSRIIDLCRIPPIFDGLDLIIRKANRFDLLPYLVHTNRELDLMLEKRKPLAVFYADVLEEDISNYIPIIPFAPYVLSEKLTMCEYTFINAPHNHPKENKKRAVRYVLYALPSERWRIEAYYLMQKISTDCGWSEAFERIQGALLGYEEWQIEIFIETVYKKQYSG